MGNRLRERREDKTIAQSALLPQVNVVAGERVNKRLFPRNRSAKACCFGMGTPVSKERAAPRDGKFYSEKT
jgi:hypothetical protein